MVEGEELKKKPLLKISICHIVKLAYHVLSCTQILKILNLITKITHVPSNCLATSNCK